MIVELVNDFEVKVNHERKVSNLGYFHEIIAKVNRKLIRLIPIN